MRRDQLPVNEPCHADWSGMTGDERRRFCGSCQKHVHDLSAMSAGDARRLVSSGRDLCVRYAVDARGEVVHRPGRAARVLVVGAALVSAPAFASTAPAPQAPASPDQPSLVERFVRYVSESVRAALPAPPEVVIMGEVVPVPPPPPPPPQEELVLGRLAPPPQLLVPVDVREPPTIPEAEAPASSR